ncbi:MAG: GxxExxY protein [Pirellulales bacterium]|nr:GxxExxY protein [Pirellulales bacterium]
MRENELAAIVVDVAYQIHRRLGPGLLESAYQAIMSYELRLRGLHVETEVPIPVLWCDVRLEVGFRVDLWIERLLLVELKSIEALAPVHKKQMLTYLRITNSRLGLLINFGEELIKNGIVRLVNGLPDEMQRT